MPPMTRGEIDLANAIVRSLNRIADSQVKQTAMMEQMVEISERQADLSQQLLDAQLAMINASKMAMEGILIEEPTKPTGQPEPVATRPLPSKTGRRPITLVDTGDKL